MSFLEDHPREANKILTGEMRMLSHVCVSITVEEGVAILGQIKDTAGLQAFCF